MRVLVTGTAGFIGFHVARALLARGDEVLGIDVVDPYYDVNLKEARLELLERASTSYRHLRTDLVDNEATAAAFTGFEPDRVVHLAAQAGVRYSLSHPESYVQNNIVAFANVLEMCRHGSVDHLVYASSSSVYGANTRLPFSERDNVDHPVSLYAASKKANELMAHTYAHLFDLPVTGLRFFTVYGPWGRPDMAYFLFTKAILAGEPIRIFNHGQLQRDFTYIDDVVEGVVRLVDRIPTPDPEWDGADPNPSTSLAPYRIYNIGNHDPIELMRLIDVLETTLDREAVKVFTDMQAGDVHTTHADVSDLARDVGFAPATRIEEGVARFVDWYVSFYGRRA